MVDARSRICTINRKGFYKMCQHTVDAFDALPLTHDREKPRVGVVGDSGQFHPTANNELVKVIEAEGCEANVPGLWTFLFGMTNAINTNKELGTKLRVASRIWPASAGSGLRGPINTMLEKSDRFEPYPDIFELAKKAEQILSSAIPWAKAGCLQPRCAILSIPARPISYAHNPLRLPNHVVGKAVINACDKCTLRATSWPLTMTPAHPRSTSSTASNL